MGDLVTEIPGWPLIAFWRWAFVPTYLSRFSALE